MDITISKADKETDAKGAPVRIAFTLVLVEKPDNLVWEYELSPAEVAQVAAGQLTVDDVVKRETQNALKAFDAQTHPNTVTTIASLASATVDPVTLAITPKP